MTSPLYWLMALSFFFVALGMLIHDRYQVRRPHGEERSFRQLVIGTVCFSLLDAVWGFLSFWKGSSQWLFIVSMLFHEGFMVMMLLWVNYILWFFQKRIRNTAPFRVLAVCAVILQAVLLLINCFHPILFSVLPDGRFLTRGFRFLPFTVVTLIFLAVIVCGLFCAFLEKGRERERYQAAQIFAIVAILPGVLQYFFPFIPLMSLAFFLDVAAIHLFIVQQERRQQIRARQQRREDALSQLIAEQSELATMDALTGLHNRYGYDQATKQLSVTGLEDDFVYLAVDLCGLKEVNDQCGHEAGDELLRSAAACLKKCIGEHGQVYRMGGDEFVAMFCADAEGLDAIRRNIHTESEQWHGSSRQALVLSCGFVMHREYPEMDLSALARVADARMYESKGRYYVQNGIDRRGQEQAFVRLSTLYHTVLRVDLWMDTYMPIQPRPQGAISGCFSQWLAEYTRERVHPEEQEQFDRRMKAICLGSLEVGTHLLIKFREKQGDRYVDAVLETLPASQQEEGGNFLYLYVRTCGE